MNFLHPEEIQILTGYQRYPYQRRELDKMGVPYRKRHDGFPVVYTGDLNNEHDIHSRINEHEEEPNFEGL